MKWPKGSTERWGRGGKKQGKLLGSTLGEMSRRMFKSPGFHFWEYLTLESHGTYLAGPHLLSKMQLSKISTMLIPRMLSRENEGKNQRETIVACFGVKA